MGKLQCGYTLYMLFNRLFLRPILESEPVKRFSIPIAQGLQVGPHVTTPGIHIYTNTYVDSSVANWPYDQ